MSSFAGPRIFALFAFPLAVAACAQAVETSGTAGSGAGGAGGFTSSTSTASSGTGGTGPCVTAADCASLSDTCNVGTCINGACEKTPANDFMPCDDGKQCSEGDQCSGGVCTGTPTFCPSMDTCHLGVCDLASDSCMQVAGNEGATCDDQDPCTTSGTCQSGTCAKGSPIDCSFLNGTCTVGSCDPVIGCVALPQADGAPCDDALFCTVMDVCQNGKCQGVPNLCKAPNDVCQIASCNEATDSCISVPGNDGVACDDGSTCTTGETCGNGVCTGGLPTNNGGACNDKKACTTNDTCSNGICGGTAVVACVNGDGCCPPSCTQLNDDDCGGAIFLTSSNGSPGFYGYDVETNVWTVLAPPPITTYSQITNDGQHVLLLGSDNNVYEFDTTAKTWSKGQVGPTPKLSAQPIGFFKWTPSALYYLKDGDSTLYRSANGGAWVSTLLPFAGSCAGTYDPVTDSLYIRGYGNMSLVVYSVASNTITKSYMLPQSVGENSRTGAYFNGSFYERDWNQPFQKLDVNTGIITPLAINPLEEHTSTDVDLQSGDIFIGPYDPTGTTFQVFHVPTNVLQTLAPLPQSVTNHSTITLVK